MFKVVKILWTDAVSIGEWKSLAELPENASPCCSIGILVKTTRDYYYVANTISKDATETEIMSNGVMMIPKKWVLKKPEEIEVSFPWKDHA